MAGFWIRPERLVLALCFATAAILADQFTKLVILEFVMQPPRIIPVTSFLNLTLSFNSGISFGLFGDFFQDRTRWLTAVTALIALGLMIWAAAAGDRREASALGLIAGGATGNIIDRIERGAVTDFIDIHIAGWHWPASNLADVSVAGGSILLIGAVLLPVSATHDRVERDDGR